MKGIHFLLISFFLQSEYTTKSDVVGGWDFGFLLYFTNFNPDYLGLKKKYKNPHFIPLESLEKWLHCTLNYYK